MRDTSFKLGVIGSNPIARCNGVYSSVGRALVQDTFVVWFSFLTLHGCPSG